MSQNFLDLAPAHDPTGTATIFTDASYNGSDFVPQSIEIDATSNIAPITLSLDGLLITLQPGTYVIRDLDAVRVVKITATEMVYANFYAVRKAERLVIAARNISYQNLYNYQNNIAAVFCNLWGMYGQTLNVIYNAGAAKWYWDTTNPAPFNASQNIETPVKVLSADAKRIHTGFSSAAILYGVPIALRYATSNGGEVSVLSPGALYFDAPNLVSELWIGFAAGSTGTPANGTNKPLGIFSVDSYSTA